MKKLTTNKNVLAKREQGATMIEYAVIAAVIVVAVIAIMGTLGDDLKTAFGTIGTNIKGATTAPAE